MTDQTPRTEAGRAMLRDPMYRHAIGHILAIEAEAREQGFADAMRSTGPDYDRGRADALREAAERVRALPWYGMFAARDRTVLAILAGETER